MTCPQIVAGCSLADNANSGETSALTCRALQHSGWLNQRIPKNRGEIWALTWCVIHHSGWLDQAKKENRVLIRALTCRASQHTGWLSPRLPSVQRPDHSPHLSCPLPQWQAEPTPTEPTEARTAP